MRAWSCEIRRIFGGYRLYLAIIGTAAALFFSLEVYGLEKSVTDSYLTSDLGSGVMLCYVFATYVYGTIFCQELEHRYLYYELVRENLKHYVVKKVILIFTSAVLVIAAGTMVFGFISRIFLPWSVQGEGAYTLLVQGLYGGLLERGHFVWYLFLNSLHTGMLAGLLTLGAALFSLFITNRIMVLCFPVLLLEIFYLFPGTMVIPMIFSAALRGGYSRWVTLTIPILACGAGMIIFGVLIYKVLQSRM